MAFVVNNNQQMAFSDGMFTLTEREKKFLEKSWANVFSEKIFPAIRGDDFSVLYSSKASRPNTPVNVIIGALILKEALGDTDEEIVQALMFDIRYQYALHTTSFEEQPLSDRTLSRFRARCLAYETETGIDLIHNCIIGLAKEISEFMGGGQKHAAHGQSNGCSQYSEPLPSGVVLYLCCESCKHNATTGTGDSRGPKALCPEG